MLCELMLQGLEAQPLGLGSFIAEATALIGLIFVVVAVKEDHFRITLKRENVRRNTVKEPTIMRGNHRTAREFQERLFKSAQRFNVQIV